MSNQLTIIGIDNGHDGALAFLGEAVQVYPMPIIEYTAPPRKGKKHARIVREYDEGAIVALFEGLDSSNAFAYLEESRAMSRFDPKEGKIVSQGAVANFSTGAGYGFIRGVLAAHGIPYQIVPPKTWQSRMLAGMPRGDDGKGRAKLVAARLFPDVDLRRNERCRGPHDGICDALLIAEWGRRSRGS